MNASSPLDGVRKQIEEWISEGRSYRHIARLVSQELGTATSERSVRRAVRRWGIASGTGNGPRFDKAGFRLNGDEADITSDPREWKAYLNDTTQLLRERGLDPAEWEIQSLVVNEWDSPTGETLKQLKVHCRRVKPVSLLVPARVSLGRIFPSIAHILSEDEPELVVCVGDHHAPHHDTELHKRFCAFMDDQRPERGILMGDLIDLSKESRHPADPDWDAETQECLDVGSQIVVDYREASDETNWVKLPGNHLERLRRIIIDRLGHWYGLTPAKVETLPDLPPIHDPAYLLRLDELGVEYLKPKGSYHHAQYMVSPYLAAKHGSVAKRGSGTSALASLTGIDHSLIMGHTHRQSLVQRTVAQIDGSSRLLQAAEAGCMCQIRDGLGYNPGPDWSNGFVTASIWPDGTFKLDHATFVDNRLYWRNERY